MKISHTQTVKGYIARDKNGDLFFYPGCVKPIRNHGVFFPMDDGPFRCISIPEDNIDITWKDEPREAIMTMQLDVESK